MPINKIAHSSFEVERENYISLLRAGQSISDIGWRTYADAAGTAPVDGTGGTPNITWAQNTSSPLSGDADLRMVKDAVNRQGQGVSIDFTVSNRHLAKVLQITFDMELISGTYASGDLRVYIVADPGGTPVVIEPVGTNIELGIANQRVREIASFQTSPTVTSYRLCVHVSSTSASAYTVDFANFRVWEPVQSVGSVVTDWISYTPSTTRANTTNRSFYYRRVGGGIQISFGWQYTSGVIGSSTALLTDIFPPGLTLDLTRIAPANGSGFPLRYNIGYYFVNDYGVNNYTGTIVWDTNQDPDQIAFMGVAPNGADDNLSGFIECPIAGWGSSVAMSSDTGDGRVVAALYRNPFAGGSSGSDPIRYNDRQYDTHNCYDTSTGRYTAPISGFYRVAFTYVETGSQHEMIIRKNGSNYLMVGLVHSSGGTATPRGNGSGTLYLNAGEYVDVVAGPTLATSALSFFSIERISAGSQQIASSESVYLRYRCTNGQTFTANTITDTQYNDRIYDSHGAYNTSNWRFTAPMSGTYLITASIIPASNSANGWSIVAFTNKTNISSLSDGIRITSTYNLSSNGGSMGSLTLRLNAGDYIRFGGTYSGTGTINLYSNAPEDYSTLTITRLGI